MLFNNKVLMCSLLKTFQDSSFCAVISVVLCVTNKDESFHPNLQVLSNVSKYVHQNEISNLLEFAFYSFLPRQDTI